MFAKNIKRTESDGYKPWCRPIIWKERKMQKPKEWCVTTDKSMN
jgi:hypothetical protein